MENLKWKEISGKKIRVFQLDEEPEIIYVIPLRLGEYMVIHDDAYELNTGKVEFLNLEDFKSKYGISLNVA
jgi:hypothetical protein